MYFKKFRVFFFFLNETLGNLNYVAHNGDYVFLQGGTGLAHEGQLASSCLDPSPREAVQPAVDKPLPECCCPAQKRRTGSGWLAVEL